MRIVNRIKSSLVFATALTVMCLLLNACGGGGGNPSPPLPAPTPPPTSVAEPVTWDQGTWDNNSWG